MTPKLALLKSSPRKAVIVALVVAVALLIASSVAFSFWPALLAICALVVSVVKYRKAFIFVIISTFLVSSMDIPGHEIWIGMRWVILGFATFSSMIMLASRGKDDAPFRFEWPHILAMLTFCVAFFSAAVSVNRTMTVLKALTVLSMFFYCLFGVRISIRRNEKYFLYAFTLWAEAVIYICFISYVVMEYPLFPNPNTLGGIVGIAAWPLLFARLMSLEPGMSKLRYLVPLLMCGYLIYMSESRASILGAGIATLFICFAYRRFAFSGVAVSVMAGLLIALQAYHPFAFKEQIDHLLVKHSEYSNALDSRQDAWAEGVVSISKSPWFGSGFGVSAGLSEEWQSSLSSEDADREKGNSYLAIVEAVGFIGCVIPFALVFLLLTRISRVCAWRQLNKVALSFCVPLAAVLLSGLVNAFFEAWLFAVGSYITILFWITAFALIDCARIGQQGSGSVADSKRPNLVFRVAQ